LRTIRLGSIISSRDSRQPWLVIFLSEHLADVFAPLCASSTDILEYAFQPEADRFHMDFALFEREQLTEMIIRPA
jgi:hypothetical protein